VWRIIVAFSLIPAFGTLYQRLTLPESTRYISAQKLKHDDQDNAAKDDIDELKAQKAGEIKIKTRARSDTEKADVVDSASDDAKEVDEAAAPPDRVVKKKAHFKGILRVTLTWICNAH
jgi:MFS transporter, PHS family, inorganic phosphate transporter